MEATIFCEHENKALWYQEAVFYHVYALGMLGCEGDNDFGAVRHRLRELLKLISYWKDLGVNAVLIGPVFSSVRHGYDTADFFRIDERLGDAKDFADFVWQCHEAGIKVIVDAVFNHVGRQFWAFRDLLEHRENSACREYFGGLNLCANNSYNDGLRYDSWEGHEELVKLDLSRPAARQHLLLAVEHWMRDYGIDGLRLDAADCLDKGFIRELRHFCKSRRPDFYLVGEVIHGDYRHWANAEMLDATTNYEAYKGLWSSQNDANYHEIAWTLKREFEHSQGIYERLPMLNFVDNHDVARLASVLKDEDDLFAVYALLFTMPGVPCLYYGSEWAVRGKKLQGFEADNEIRARISAQELLDSQLGTQSSTASALHNAITRLAHFRARHRALTQGSYEQIAVSSQCLAFKRECSTQSLVCVLSGESMPRNMEIALDDGIYIDVLNGGEITARGAKAQVFMYPKWVRVLEKRN